MSDERIPRTIYDLGMALARIEGKMDNLIAAESRSEERHKSHEARLTTIEKNMWKGLGGVTVLSALPWLLPLGKNLFNR